MEKFSRSPARVRVLLALPVLLGSAFLVACGDDDPAWPSNAAVQELRIQKVPAGAPSLMIETYGDSLRLLGVPVDADGTWVDQPVTWTSSNPAVADVVVQTGADGRPYGVLKFAANPAYVNETHVDTVTVTATSGSHTSEIQVVTREDPRVDEVSVTSVTPFVTPGTTMTLTATSRDGFGNAIPAPNPWVWASGAPSVATVVDNEDGTATVTTVGEGTAVISAAVANAGEPPETGTVTGTTTVIVPPQVASGATFTMPTISDGSTSYWTVAVPPGASSLVVQIAAGGDATGDADLYVYSPGTVPTLTNFVCRPFLVGSNETCTIEDPAAGTWGIGVRAWPGDGDVADTSLSVTVN